MGSGRPRAGVGSGRGGPPGGGTGTGPRQPVGGATRRALLARLTLASSGVAVAPALTGCAQGRETTDAAPPPAAAPVPLRFQMCCSNATVYKLMDDLLLPAFKTKHPHVSDVTLEVGNAAEARTMLRAQPAAGTPPDVMRPSGPHHELVDSGTLADLAPLVGKDKGFDLNDFYPRVTDYYRQPKRARAGNALWGLPQNYATESLYYNRATLRAAGVPAPDDNVTWDDLVTHAKRVKAGGAENWGVEVRTVRIDHILWSFGGGFVDDTGSQVTVGEPASIQALEYVGDLFNRHQVQPTEADVRAVAGGTRWLFETARLGFQFGTEGNVARHNQVNGLDYDVAPVPKGPKGRFTFFFPGGVCALAGSKHPAAAYDLCKWFAGDPQVVEEFIWKTGASPSARISLNERYWKTLSNRPTGREALLKNPSFGKVPYFMYRMGDEAMEVVNATLPDVWNGKRGAREVAMELQTKLTAVFRR